MGVMRCSRDNCNHVLCHLTILENRLYICADCFNELTEHKNTWQPPMTKLEIRAKIEEFMNTEVGAYFRMEGATDIDEEFRKLTSR